MSENPDYSVAVDTRGRWDSVSKAYWNTQFWDDADVNGPEKIAAMIEACYAPLNGYYPGRADQVLDLLVQETDVWFVLDVRDPKAIAFAKTTGWGLKWICVAAAEEVGAKKALLEKMLELVEQDGNYAELSGPLMNAVERRSPRITNLALIQLVVNKPGVIVLTDFSYTRARQGQIIRKALFGKPRKT